MVKVMVGGVGEVIANRVRGGQTDELPILADPLVEWMLSYRSRPATEIIEQAGEQSAERRPTAPAGPPKSADPSGEVPEQAGLCLEQEESARPVVWRDPHERILAAVTEIVAANGYDALSVAQVCRGARRFFKAGLEETCDQTAPAKPVPSVASEAIAGGLFELMRDVVL